MKAIKSTIYTKNQTIFLEQQLIGKVYFLAEGNIRTYKTDIRTGRIVTLELVNGGNYFGYFEIIAMNKNRMTSSAVISKTAIVHDINIDEFSNKLLRNVEFQLEMLRMCKLHYTKLWQRILQLQQYRSEKNIGYALISMANDQVNEIDIKIIENYTHQLLAEYTGSTRNRITSTLNHFRRLGLIEYDRSEIIVNVKLLKRNILLKENG